MTIDQVIKLVRAILAKTSPASKDAGVRTLLKTMGIQGAALRAFKRSLVEAPQLLPLQLRVGSFSFGENATLGDVIAQVVAKIGSGPELKESTAKKINAPDKPTSVKKSAAKKTLSAKPISRMPLPAPPAATRPSLPKIHLDAPPVKVRKNDVKAVRWNTGASSKGFDFILPKGEENLVFRHGSFASRNDGVGGSGGDAPMPRPADKTFSGPAESLSKVSSARPYRGRQPSQTIMRVRGPGGSGDADFDLLSEIADGAASEAAGAPVEEAVEAAPNSTAEPPTPKKRTLECTPQMEMAGPLKGGRTQGMTISLDQGAVAPGAQVQKARFEVSSDVDTIAVDVWFDSSSHFALEAPQDATLKLHTATGASDALPFTITLQPTAEDAPMYVSAFFRHNGRPCGKITRFLQQTAKGLKWVMPKANAAPDGEVILPKEAAAAAVSVQVDAKPADIRVEVLRTAANDGQHFTLECSSTRGTWKGDWTLPQVTKDLVNAYLQRFISSKGNARIAALKSAGADFWDALPQGARDLIWEAMEAGAETLSVHSQEPYIPWEIMVPYRTVRKPKQPLGVALRVGRWITGDYVSPPQTLNMRSMHVVNPGTSGLQNSGVETTFLKSLPMHPVDVIAPATFDAVNTRLADAVLDVVHFICHGKSATLQTLQLESPETLDCGQVRMMDGFQKNFENGGFAFLNACEVGGSVQALDGVGGFANSFIELGAFGVVAPLWAVQDAVAPEIAKMFYQGVQSGAAIAEVMKQIRAQAYSSGLDSYAAYCFYGDPCATAIFAGVP